MYELYYMPGACSMAFHVMLKELGQPVTLINRQDVADYEAINPAGTVPVLKDGDTLVREGASIALYLAEKHQTGLLPASGKARTAAIDAMMFANATMHPAYSKMFFAANALESESAKQEALRAAAANVTRLWKTVDDRLATSAFLAGDEMTIADVMLAVYANWGSFFPVEIPLGANAERMLGRVTSRPSFRAALSAEGVAYKAVA